MEENYKISGNGAIAPHQVYRAMGWLDNPLPDDAYICQEFVTGKQSQPLC